MRYLMLFSFMLLTACGTRTENIALGTLERDRIAHTATANEVVVALPVTRGSKVTKGTLLVKLDDTLQQAQVHKAEAELSRAEAELAKLQQGVRPEEIAAARAKVAALNAVLLESEANYKRLLDLIKNKAISEMELDKALATRDTNFANVQSAQEQLHELTNGAREEDLRAAEAYLKSARATLTSEKKKMADLSIVATRDGILDSLPWNLGERVTLGSPLAIVLAGKAPYARIYVPEPYRVKINVGDDLIVHVDGIEQAIKGKLSWVASEPAFTPYYALNQEERSRLMYLAYVQLPDSEAHLPSGIPAQVELP